MLPNLSGCAPASAQYISEEETSSVTASTASETLVAMMLTFWLDPRIS